MRRTMAIVRGAGTVRHRAASRSGLTASPGAATAPGPHHELELLNTSRHLNRANVSLKLASLSIAAERDRRTALQSGYVVTTRTGAQQVGSTGTGGPPPSPASNGH